MPKRFERILENKSKVSHNALEEILTGSPECLYIKDIGRIGLRETEEEYFRSIVKFNYEGIAPTLEQIAEDMCVVTNTFFRYKPGLVEMGLITGPNIISFTDFLASGSGNKRRIDKPKNVGEFYAKEIRGGGGKSRVKAIKDIEENPDLERGHYKVFHLAYVYTIKRGREIPVYENCLGRNLKCRPRRLGI